MSGGFGISPFGVGPYGYGTPPGAPTPAATFFGGQNVTSAQSFTGRAINPATRQYIFDAAGRIAGQDTVQQLVYLAYATKKGTSVIASLGSSILGTDTIDETFQAVLTARATEPIQSLIDDGRVSVVSVDVTRFSADGVSIAVRWKDTSTGRENTVNL